MQLEDPATARGLIVLWELQRLLLSEMSAFGKLQMQLLDDRDPELQSKIEPYIIRRQFPMHVLFFALEEHGIGESYKSSTPYRLPTNQTLWPIAGYVSEPGPSVPMSAIQHCQFTYWANAAGSDDPVRQELIDSLGPVLRIVGDHGMKAAVSYVSDLLVNGHLLAGETAVLIVRLLLAARSQSSSDQQMIERIAKSTTITNENFRPSIDWIDLKVPISKEMVELVGVLISKALALVNGAKAATSLDQWLPLVNSIHVISRVVQRIVNRTVSPISPALSAILTDLDEVMADAGALPVTYGVTQDFGEVVSAERSLLAAMQKTLGSEVGRQRFTRERLLIPEWMLDIDRHSIPLEWSQPSWHYFLLMQDRSMPDASAISSIEDFVLDPKELSPRSQRLLEFIGLAELPENDKKSLRTIFLRLEDPEVWRSRFLKLQATGADPLVVELYGSIESRIRSRTSPSLS